MVSSVQVQIIWVDEQKPKEDEQNLQRALPTVHKVSIKDVWLLAGR